MPPNPPRSIRIGVKTGVNFHGLCRRLAVTEHAEIPRLSGFEQTPGTPRAKVCSGVNMRRSTDQTRERLFEFRIGHRTVACERSYHEESGVEAQFIESDGRIGLVPEVFDESNGGRVGGRTSTNDAT